MTDKREEILKWLDAEIESVTTMPVMNPIPDMPPGKGQKAAEILNYGYMHALLALKGSVPDVDRQGFVSETDSRAVDRIHLAMRKLGLLVPRKA